MKKHAIIALPALLICLFVGAAIGCSPAVTPAGNTDPGNVEPEPAFAWSADTDCSMCHQVQTDSFSDGACLALTHASTGQQCTFCHQDTDTLKTAHAEATTDTAGVKMLYYTRVANSLCSSCHGSLESLAEKTANSTVLTDKNGLTVNPHSLPSNPQHDAITCGDCHSMHFQKTAKGSALRYCVDCHHTHVFECGSCHSVEGLWG